MARPIDAEKYMELLKEQYLHYKAMKHGESARAWQGAMQLLYDMPTLTPQNEWVSVEERPPEFPGFLDRIMVIACDKNGSVIPMVRERTLVGYEWVERWLYPWNKIYDGPEITHWMPLPKPPKGGLKNATNRR